MTLFQGQRHRELRRLLRPGSVRGDLLKPRAFLSRLWSVRKFQVSVLFGDASGTKSKSLLDKVL